MNTDKQPTVVDMIVIDLGRVLIKAHKLSLLELVFLYF